MNVLITCQTIARTVCTSTNYGDSLSNPTSAEHKHFLCWAKQVWWTSATKKLQSANKEKNCRKFLCEHIIINHLHKLPHYYATSCLKTSKSMLEFLAQKKGENEQSLNKILPPLARASVIVWWLSALNGKQTKKLSKDALFMFSAI